MKWISLIETLLTSYTTTFKFMLSILNVHSLSHFIIIDGISILRKKPISNRKVEQKKKLIVVVETNANGEQNKNENVAFTHKRYYIHNL